MLIAGEWLAGADDVTRPVVCGEMQSAAGRWEVVYFLIDVGADRTVLTAEITSKLGLTAAAGQFQVEGVGGVSPTGFVNTSIGLSDATGQRITFRGRWATLTTPGVLEMSLLGRDILDHFTVVVDRPGSRVCLVRPPHACHIA